MGSLSAKSGSLIAKDGSVTSQITVDDFERGNLNPYNPYDNIRGFEISNNRASQGSLSLRATGDGNPHSTWSNPGDGLDYYPERGDQIEVDMRVFDGHRNYFGFFHSGGETGNHYEVRIIPDDGEIQLWWEGRGTADRLGTKSCSTGGRWQTLTIETNNNQTDVTFGGSTITTNHSNQPGRGIYFFTGGSTCYWDYVRAI